MIRQFTVRNASAITINKTDKAKVHLIDSMTITDYKLNFKKKYILYKPVVFSCTLPLLPSFADVFLQEVMLSSDPKFDA